MGGLRILGGIYRIVWAGMLSWGMLRASLPAISTTATETSTTITEISTTTTETSTTTEISTTTTEISAPRLYAVADAGCPGGQTLLHLCMTENPMLSALGVRITLPDVLKPAYTAEHEIVFTPTDALAGEMAAIYNPEKSYLTFACAGTQATTTSTELGTFLLDISMTAEIGAEYEIAVQLDSVASPNRDMGDCTWSDSAILTITEPMERKLSETTVTLAAPGDTHQLTLIPAPTAGQPRWSSADARIATVDANGIVTAAAMGQTRLTAEYEGITYSCEVVVETSQRGDVNCDGDVTADDAVLALTAYVRVHVLDLENPLTPAQSALADVNRDGDVTEADAILILRYYTLSLIHGTMDWDALLHPSHADAT